MSHLCKGKLRIKSVFPKMPPNTSYNPYEILGIQKGCSDKALKDAYKLQCLKWHPDKNPNNKEEAERKFIAAKEAFQFLFDKEKRDEYDKGIDRQLAKEAKQAERLRKADTERKRFINELERREKEFSERGKNYKPSKTAEESNAKYEEKERKDEESRVRAEFEQLRKQLEKEVAEEMRAQQERMAHPVQHKHTQEEHDDCPKLRLKWTPGAAGEDYDETQLRLIFHEYGAISEVTTIFTNKKGVRMCIVEFEKGADCWGAETESGAGGPEIQAVWVTKPRETAAPTEPRPDDSSADTKPSGPDFATMSFEELQAQILGDMGPPIEKKKKWEDEQ